MIVMGKQLEIFPKDSECEERAAKVRDLINSDDPANQLLGLSLCRSLGYSKVKFVQEYFDKNTPNKWFDNLVGGEICNVFFVGVVFHIYDEYDLMLQAYNLKQPSRHSKPITLYKWKDEYSWESISRDVNRNIKKFVQEYFFDLLSLLK